MVAWKTLRTKGDPWIDLLPAWWWKEGPATPGFPLLWPPCLPSHQTWSVRNIELLNTIKMTRGTPEVRSDKSLTLLTFDIWFLTIDIWHLTFNQWTNGPIVQWTNGPMDQWTNGPMDLRLQLHWYWDTYNIIESHECSKSKKITCHGI